MVSGFGWVGNSGDGGGYEGFEREGLGFFWALGGKGGNIIMSFSGRQENTNGQKRTNMGIFWRGITHIHLGLGIRIISSDFNV